MLKPCPACGFEVFERPPGSYDICPVCDWEDDDVQLRFPLLPGGANGRSLAERQAWLLRRLPPPLTEYRGYRRCPDCRPLGKHNCDATGAPTTGFEYFNAIGAEEPVYYWRKPRSQP